MTEVVHCVYNSRAEPNILLHVIVQEANRQYLLHLAGVNIGDDAVTISDTATFTLGVDPLSGDEIITPHCQLTSTQVSSIISRSLPEVSSAIIAQFPKLLTT